MAIKDEEARLEVRDIKNTVEWELIRLSSLTFSGDEVELRPGERRSLTSAVNKLSDAVLTLARLSREE